MLSVLDLSCGERKLQPTKDGAVTDGVEMRASLRRRNQLARIFPFRAGVVFVRSNRCGS